MIQKTAIIGMGALGMLYADKIAENIGEDAVEFVMDSRRVEKYRDAVFTVNGGERRFKMVSAEAARPADLVIVAVKYPALESALDCMKKVVGAHTVILSVMNGVTSEEKIAWRYGDENVIYTVAQGMDAMKFGGDLQYTRAGELVLGVRKAGVGQEAKVEAAAEYLRKAKISAVIEKEILRTMWGKFMLNVGVNQVCMVYGINYGQSFAPGEANRMMIAAMREVRAVAELEGVKVTEQDLNFYVDLLKTLSPEGMPSMAQDRINKKASEVDMFAGSMIEMAEKHNIQVPANRYLYERVKEIEKEYV